MASLVIAMAEKLTAGPEASCVSAMELNFDPSHQFDAKLPFGVKAMNSIFVQALNSVIANCSPDDGGGKPENTMASSPGVSS